MEMTSAIICQNNLVFFEARWFIEIYFACDIMMESVQRPYVCALNVYKSQIKSTVPFLL